MAVRPAFLLRYCLPALERVTSLDLLEGKAQSELGTADLREAAGCPGLRRGDQQRDGQRGVLPLSDCPETSGPAHSSSCREAAKRGAFLQASGPTGHLGASLNNNHAKALFTPRSLTRSTEGEGLGAPLTEGDGRDWSAGPQQRFRQCRPGAGHVLGHGHLRGDDFALDAIPEARCQPLTAPALHQTKAPGGRGRNSGAPPAAAPAGHGHRGPGFLGTGVFLSEARFPIDTRRSQHQGSLVQTPSQKAGEEAPSLGGFAVAQRKLGGPRASPRSSGPSTSGVYTPDCCPFPAGQEVGEGP